MKLSGLVRATEENSGYPEGALEASASCERTLDASFSTSDRRTAERRLARPPHLGHTSVEFCRPQTRQISLVSTSAPNAASSYPGLA